MLFKKLVRQSNLNIRILLAEKLAVMNKINIIFYQELHYNIVVHILDYTKCVFTSDIKMYLLKHLKIQFSTFG